MRWKGRGQSKNVIDRRGVSKRKAIGGVSIIGIIIILIQLFGGENVQMLAPVLEQINGNSGSSWHSTQRELSKEEKLLGEFASTVLYDTELIFHRLFQEQGWHYKKPKMVLFTGLVQSKCGKANSSVGPFYCPADQMIYMDLDFFNTLRSKFGAKGGDFAIAYVIAHEVGHHIQNLLGTSLKVKQLQTKKSKQIANKLSVCLELQADFYAGVWAHHNKKHLEKGDIEEALSAAHAVGDDAIQKKLQGHVNPDSFTHGSSKQRMKWFMKGFNSGDLTKGDTFAEEL